MGIWWLHRWVYAPLVLTAWREAPWARRLFSSAWGNVVKSIQRESDDEPPRWLCVGWLPDGRSVELIAVETIFGWLIIHAMSPVQPKFAKEIAQTERRTR